MHREVGGCAQRSGFGSRGERGGERRELLCIELLWVERFEPFGRVGVLIVCEVFQYTAHQVVGRREGCVTDGKGERHGEPIVHRLCAFAQC